MKLIFAVLSLLCINASATCRISPIKIAVIDTGFGYHGEGQAPGQEPKLCKYGHKDFSIDGQSTRPSYIEQDHDPRFMYPTDTNGHGTNIVGIIDSYMKKSKVNYCIVILKYYSDAQSGMQNLDATIKAIQYATNIGVDYINYSGGGPTFSNDEYLALKKAEDKKIKVVVAAGNDNSDIGIPGNEYYPASYDLPDTIIVGNKREDGVRSESSNYGTKVNRWEVGENVTAYEITMTGTSQATAIATGKLASENHSKCDIGHQ